MKIEASAHLTQHHGLSFPRRCLQTHGLWSWEKIMTHWENSQMYNPVAHKMDPLRDLSLPFEK